MALSGGVATGLPLDGKQEKQACDRFIALMFLPVIN
jgi:hypothetical protein